MKKHLSQFDEGVFVSLDFVLRRIYRMVNKASTVEAPIKTNG